MHALSSRQTTKQPFKPTKKVKPVTISHADSIKNILQPKLKIGQANDQYEQEADRVAEQIMRMPESESTSKANTNSFSNINSSQQHAIVQRSCAACREESDLIQRKKQPALTSEVPANITTSMQSLKASGSPLAQSERSFFEPRFGTSFSGVRLHHNQSAAKTAESIQARAFTLGQHIVFGAGQYSPGSAASKKLLAHELTHVIQQKGASSSVIQRYTCQNNPATAPSSGMSDCRTENSRPSHANVTINFSENQSGIGSAAQTALSGVAASWHANARNDTVRIDAYSSCEGASSANWRLSCRRAGAIEGELKAPSDGTTGIPVTATFNKFSHGETEEFSTSVLAENRKGQVTLQPVATALPAVVPTAGPTDFRINRIPRSSQSQIFFGAGSSTLTADAITQIDGLKSTSPASVRLIGFASLEEAGSLAQDRANAVRARLAATPDAVNVTSAVGNAAATANRSNLARARNVEILVGTTAPSTVDCALTDPVTGTLVNPPKVPCATMDPATVTAFTAAHTVANDAMTKGMNSITPAHSNYNPTLIQQFFGNSDPATLSQLATNMGNLRSHVSGLTGNLATPVDGISSIIRCAGQCDTGGCESGRVIAYNNGVDANSVFTLCVPVFKGLNQNDQARNVIHESAHGTSPLGGAGDPTGGTKDVAYRHERMMFHLSPQDRLRNSDSYALFAMYARERITTGVPTAIPTGIRTPESDIDISMNTTDRAAVDLAIAQLEKRLSWAADHSNQLFGQAQKVRAGTLAWSATWAQAYMQEAARSFPLTSPPAAPTVTDMTTLAAIIERYKIMKFEINRDLIFMEMPTGIISWPVGGNGLASTLLSFGPGFYRANAENQVSLLLQNLAASTPDVETAFIPAYVSFAKFIHDNAS